MKTFIQPRLRKPAGIVAAGTVFVVAWAIHGGSRWWLWAALFGIMAAARAIPSGLRSRGLMNVIMCLPPHRGRTSCRPSGRRTVRL